MAKDTAGNWFEQVADIDVDSAAFQIGLHHYVIGHPRPGFMIATGAVDIAVNFHEGDVDDIIDAFKALKRKLAKKVLA